MTANVRYSDPFTSADKEVAAPEGAEFVVVRKRGEAAVDGEVVSFHSTREEAREACLLYTSPSPRDKRQSRMPSSA